jgi:hypothetical protein
VRGYTPFPYENVRRAGPCDKYLIKMRICCISYKNAESRIGREVGNVQTLFVGRHFSHCSLI